MVCLLSKLNTKQHLEIDLYMDELDLTAAESKATCEEHSNILDCLHRAVTVIFS